MSLIAFFNSSKCLWMYTELVKSWVAWPKIFLIVIGLALYLSNKVARWMTKLFYNENKAFQFTKKLEPFSIHSGFY